MAILRANPFLTDIIEVLDIHLQKYQGDTDKARSYLSAADNEWIDNEILHCITDSRYYISNYYAYRDEKEGFKGLYPLFDSQEILHEEYQKLKVQYGRVRALVLKSRQMGSTTYNVARFSHETVFFEHINGIMVGKDQTQAESMFGMYDSALDFLPWWMKPRIAIRQSGTKINFDEKDEFLRATRPGNKTWIYCENANKPSGVGRGQTFNKALLSELSFWQNGSQLSKSLFPTFNSPDGFYVMESTANGRNDFWHNLWRRAEAAKVDWHPIFIPFYRRAKTYSIPIFKGENLTLTLEEKEVRERVQKKDGFVIKDETFKWMRNKKEEFVATDGDDMMFFQEYCLIGSTKVSTDEGLIPISKLGDGYGLLAGGEQITAWASKGVKPVFRATTKMGYRIIGTADHVVPTLDAGDVELGDLTGRTVQLCIPEFGAKIQRIEWKETFGTVCSITVDESVARFLGLFVGDGCYASDSVIFCCDRKDQDVIEDLSSLMISLFGGCHSSTVGTKNGGVQLRVGSVGFKKVMQKFGIYQTEKPHRRVVVPEVIFQSPRSVVKEFLKGVFEADGFCGYEGNRVSLFAKGVEFLRDIQLLLLGFGITSRISSQKKTNGDGRKYTGNALDLRTAEARLFCEQIGFIGNRKQSRQRTIEHKIGRPLSKIVLTDQVVSVTPEGDQEVFDITVENSHLFSANGIIVHNCGEPEEAFQSSAITAFPRGIINKLRKRTRNPRWIGEISYDFAAEKVKTRVKEVDPLEDLTYPETENRLSIWEMPEAGARYCAGADVSLGNEGGDYSSISVVKLTDGLQDKLVAQWHGYIDPESLAEPVLALCWMYNEALAAVEVNSMGLITNNRLVRDYEYENIYRYKHLDKLKNWMTDLIGFYTNEKMKRAIMSKMSKALLDDAIEIPDKFIIDEFYDFTEYGAEGTGAHDDYIMSLMIALYCGHEGEYREIREGIKPKNTDTTGMNEFVILDRFGTIKLKTTSQKEAEVTAKKHIGAQIIRTPGATAIVKIAGQKQKVPADYYNTDYSPVHDGDGPAHHLVYEEGYQPEEVTSEMIAQYEADQQEESEDPNAWMYQ